MKNIKHCEVDRLQARIKDLELEVQTLKTEPDWSESQTGTLSPCKNPLLSKSERLIIADGAIHWRDQIIKNLRSQLSEQATFIVSKASEQDASSDRTRNSFMSLTEKDLPEGYGVKQMYGGKWLWESILAPECHSAYGFDSKEEAIKDCLRSNYRQSLCQDDDLTPQAACEPYRQLTNNPPIHGVQQQ